MIKHSAIPLRVAAIFSTAGTIKPVWFDWEGVKHNITETTYRWEDRRGAALRLHFTVTTESGLFELTYNTLEQSWNVSPVDNILNRKR